MDYHGKGKHRCAIKIEDKIKWVELKEMSHCKHTHTQACTNLLSGPERSPRKEEQLSSESLFISRLNFSCCECWCDCKIKVTDRKAPQMWSQNPLNGPLVPGFTIGHKPPPAPCRKLGHGPKENVRMKQNGNRISYRMKTIKINALLSKCFFFL